MGETVGKRFHVQPARSLFLSSVGLSSPEERGSPLPLTDGRFSSVGGRCLKEDETVLNESRFKNGNGGRRGRAGGVELERNSRKMCRCV